MNALLIPLLLLTTLFLTLLSIVLSIAWVWMVAYVAYEFVRHAARLTHYVKGKLRLVKCIMHDCVRATNSMIRRGVEWMTDDMPHFLWYVVAPLLWVLYGLCMWVHYAKK